MAILQHLFPNHFCVFSYSITMKDIALRSSWLGLTSSIGLISICKISMVNFHLQSLKPTSYLLWRGIKKDVKHTHIRDILVILLKTVRWWSAESRKDLKPYWSRTEKFYKKSTLKNTPKFTWKKSVIEFFFRKGSSRTTVRTLRNFFMTSVNECFWNIPNTKKKFRLPEADIRRNFD